MWNSTITASAQSSDCIAAATVLPTLAAAQEAAPDIQPYILTTLLFLVGVVGAAVAGIALYGAIDILRDSHMDKHDEEATEHHRGDIFRRS